jgi:hypothetical protein
MHIKELHEKYPKGTLDRLPGDVALKYEAFYPLFQNLYENKIVFYDRFLAIVILEDIDISDWGFRARAIPYLEIERVDIPLSKRSYRYRMPDKSWFCAGKWDFIWFNNTHLGSPYGGYSIWPDPEQVKYVELLTIAKRFIEAINASYDEKYNH